MAMAHDSFQYEVMISYKWKDSKRMAIDLEAYLKQQNKRVFRDENELKAGQSVTDHCQQAIHVSRVFLPIISKYYSEGASGREFLYNQDTARRPVVPVVMEGGVVPSNYQIEDILQVRIKADFEENKEEYYKKILDGVNAHLTGPSRSGTFGQPSHDNAPLCDCEKPQPAILLTTKKEGSNKGRQFYKCNQQTRKCRFFRWADKISYSSSLSSNVMSTPSGSQPSAPSSSSVKCYCNLDAAEHTVKKKGPNTGRKFFNCPKPMGSQCKFYKWADDVPKTNAGLGQESPEGSRKRKQTTCSTNGESEHTKRPKHSAPAQQTSD